MAPKPRDPTKDPRIREALRRLGVTHVTTAPDGTPTIHCSVEKMRAAAAEKAPARRRRKTRGFEPP